MNRRGIICAGGSLVDHDQAIVEGSAAGTLPPTVAPVLERAGPAYPLATALARLDPEVPVWPNAPLNHDLSKCTARMLHLGARGTCLDQPAADDPLAWVSVLQRARAAGLKTSLAMACGAPDEVRRLVLPCLPFLNTLIISDRHAGVLSGIDIVCAGVTSTGAARRAAVALLVKGPLDLVVIHFSGGCIAATGDGEVRARPSLAAPAGDIESGNGAGEAFVAGMLYAIHEAWSIGEGLSLGLCAAAWRSVSAPATLGTVAECLTLAKRWGWRAPI